MSVGVISSGSAVSAAIAEFDALGRNVFLTKYGIGPARSYFLHTNGLEYDSKAIVGVALGYQFPDFGPLACTEFSRGAGTAADNNSSRSPRTAWTA